MADPRPASELEEVRRSHRAARRQLRTLSIVNRTLTAAAVLIVLAYLVSFYGRVRVMYHPDQFEGPVQDEAQILLPKIEPELRALWSETAPVYGDLAREKLEESLPEVLASSQQEFDALVAGMQVHATEAVDEVLTRVARKHRERLQAEFPELSDREDAERRMTGWMEVADSDLSDVVAHLDIRYAEDLAQLQETLDQFTASEYESMSQEELTRQFIHLWLMKVDRWVLLGDEGDPLDPPDSLGAAGSVGSSDAADKEVDDVG